MDSTIKRCKFASDISKRVSARTITEITYCLLDISLSTFLRLSKSGDTYDAECVFSKGIIVISRSLMTKLIEDRPIVSAELEQFRRSENPLQPTGLFACLHLLVSSDEDVSVRSIGIRAQEDYLAFTIEDRIKLLQTKFPEISTERATCMAKGLDDMLAQMQASPEAHAEVSKATIELMGGPAAALKRISTHAEEVSKLARSCSHCYRRGIKLMICSGCDAAWYCGKECQSIHWKAAHKAQCADIRRKTNKKK